jgi:hypothetical protein
MGFFYSFRTGNFYCAGNSSRHSLRLDGDWLPVDCDIEVETRMCGDVGDTLQDYINSHHSHPQFNF